MSSPWNDARYVFLTAKACPACGSARFIHCWSSNEGDGTRTQREICRRCSARIVFVLEPPEENPRIGEVAEIRP